MECIFYNKDSQNGVKKLIYTGIYDDYDGISVKELNLDTRETTDSNMKYGRLGEVFEDAQGNYWIYEDTRGNCTALISSTEYSGTEDYSVKLQDIALVDDTVYYSVVYSKYNPELSMGWRDGYEWKKTEVYRKKINNSQPELIYEY